MLPLPLGELEKRPRHFAAVGRECIGGDVEHLDGLLAVNRFFCHRVAGEHGQQHKQLANYERDDDRPVGEANPQKISDINDETGEAEVLAIPGCHGSLQSALAIEATMRYLRLHVCRQAV